MNGIVKQFGAGKRTALGLELRAFSIETHEVANMKSHFNGILDRAKEFVSRVGMLWCNLRHDELMWPAHGRYQCRRCLRYHPLEWK